jgi:hypothetical protein
MEKHSVRLLATILSLFGLIFPSVATGWAEERSEAKAAEIIFNRLAVTPFLVGQRQPNMDETLDDYLELAHHGIKEIFRPFPDSIRPGP